MSDELVVAARAVVDEWQRGGWRSGGLGVVVRDLHLALARAEAREAWRLGPSRLVAETHGTNGKGGLWERLWFVREDRSAFSQMVAPCVFVEPVEYSGEAAMGVALDAELERDDVWSPEKQLT